MFLAAIAACIANVSSAAERPYRLGSVDLKQRVIWGEECRGPNGTGLAFGGQDQQADDGRPHTRILVDGKWQAIHQELRAKNRLQAGHSALWSASSFVKDQLAMCRRRYFQGASTVGAAGRARAQSKRAVLAMRQTLNRDSLIPKLKDTSEYEQQQIDFATRHLKQARNLLTEIHSGITGGELRKLLKVQIHLEIAAESLDAEPPARALQCGQKRRKGDASDSAKSIVYDPKSKLYVLFGGDHLDYLTNDTWVFDQEKRQWFQRHPNGAPPPRANHRLQLQADGRIKLTGGYTYTSNTDYMGGQYRDLNDGEWFYDVAKNIWSGGKLVPGDTRVYRTGAFHPDYFLQGGQLLATKFQKRLDALPINRWVATNPPYRPEMNRDWGCARIDPSRDILLRWSGGHSAHGGTDVPHFHFATNRWELPCPVEFPLGQLYSNTSYPNGYNFNRRPWMTGHTYQNWAFDSPTGKMVKAGRPNHFYLYDPDVADWTSRGKKPAAMCYNSCFYTLTLTSTPRGIICWDKNGRIHQYDGKAGRWIEYKLTGDKLPGAYVDNSTITYDSKRDRVLMIGTPGYRKPFTGEIYALDLKTKRVTKLAPAGMQHAHRFATVDRCCYDAKNDVVLMATYLKTGPTDDKVLGNGRVISRWPSRGGPVILDGVLYWAAGIWQSEKIYIRAMNPDTGKVIWTNDTSGGIYMPQPHGGANAKSGVSAQGYLFANEKQLFVPTGRAVPAAFDRATGKFLYYQLQKNGHTGGTAASAKGQFVYNGGIGFVAADGSARTKLGAGQVAAFSDGILHSNGARLLAVKQVQRETKDRKGKKLTVDDHAVLWRIENVRGGQSLIVAGNTAIVGGEKSVTLVDLKTKKITGTLPVDSPARGLAVSNGQLFVSTESGSIHCFGSAPKANRVGNIAAKVESNAQTMSAAKEILAKSKITAGYCVDLGCGDGSLALELVRNSDLRIVAIDADPKNVATARANLTEAGFYGSRVTVHLGDPANTHFPKYFANLVVSGQSVEKGAKTPDPKEIKRLQRPYGGVVAIGAPGEIKPDVRGALAKAGNWSHLYSDPANTCCSLDEVKGPLSVLWYRDVDLELPQRHGRGPAPLFHNGRLFAEGMDEIRGVDAYNGRTLWRFELKGILAPYDADHIVGTSQTGSNFCAAGDSVYVRQDGHCYRLDAATGKVLGKFPTPKTKDGKPGRWGYIACTDGILFGTVVNEEHIVRHAWRRADKQMKHLFTESKFLFALDAKSGKLLWRYDAEESIRNNAIAIGDGRVFLIDRALAKDDLLSRAPVRRGKKGPKKEGHPTGKLIVLEAKTGKQKWKNTKDIFGTMLSFSEKFDMLLMSYQSTRFKLPSEVGGRMAVFRATEGYRVWDKKVNYVTRPLVNDRTIYAQGGAWDLLTGDNQPFDFKRSYGCGQIAASKHLLLFRSATLGYKDLSRKAGTENFGGIRPGCWINALPAGGLVFVPDASAGCRCSYQNRAWVALQGSE
eukprot:g8411.t1